MASHQPSHHGCTEQIFFLWPGLLEPSPSICTRPAPGPKQPVVVTMVSKMLRVLALAAAFARGSGATTCENLDGATAIMADMHDGDKKAVSIKGSALTIKPHGNDETWVVEATLDLEKCTAPINCERPASSTPGVARDRPSRRSRRARQTLAAARQPDGVALAHECPGDWRIRICLGLRRVPNRFEPWQHCVLRSSRTPPGRWGRRRSPSTRGSRSPPIRRFADIARQFRAGCVAIPRGPRAGAPGGNFSSR